MSDKRLKANSLDNVSENRHKANKKIYKQLLLTCEKKIENQNSLGNSFTILTIPSFQAGLPLYNITHAIMYIIRKLSQNGFTINGVYNNCVMLSWNMRKN